MYVFCHLTIIFGEIIHDENQLKEERWNMNWESHGKMANKHKIRNFASSKILVTQQCAFSVQSEEFISPFQTNCVGIVNMLYAGVKSRWIRLIVSRPLSSRGVRLFHKNGHYCGTWDLNLEGKWDQKSEKKKTNYFDLN